MNDSFPIQSHIRDVNPSLIGETMVDAFECQADLFTHEGSVKAVRSAAEAVGARVLQVHCSRYEPYGFTTVALLAESHIILTAWPEYKYAALNMFLCNPAMDAEVVRDSLFQYLMPKQWREGSFRHIVGNPRNMATRPYIFLAAPLTAHYDSASGHFDRSMKDSIQRLAGVIRELGCDVFSAHEREKWGDNLMAPQQCTPMDFREIQKCDAVVAMLDVPSYGVCVELGWASALHVPIVFFSFSDVPNYPTPLAEGIAEITRVSVVRGVVELTETLCARAMPFRSPSLGKA